MSSWRILSCLLVLLNLVLCLSSAIWLYFLCFCVFQNLILHGLSKLLLLRCLKFFQFLENSIDFLGKSMFRFLPWFESWLEDGQMLNRSLFPWWLLCLSVMLGLRSYRFDLELLRFWWLIPVLLSLFTSLNLSNLSPLPSCSFRDQNSPLRIKLLLLKNFVNYVRQVFPQLSDFILKESIHFHWATN